MKNNEKKIVEIIDQIEKLPELFSVAIAVAKKLENPDAKVNELAKIISTDQALTTQLLKLCNSAQYGYSKKIATIQDAIPKIGFKTLKSLIFLAISQGVLNKEVKGYNLEKGALWENSISCAVYARHLAVKSNYPDPDTAFTAGLLRDIGKLIIHEYIGDSYNEILEMINSKNISFSEAESKVLSFNHCEIGAKISEKWNFPDALVETIQYHHAPNSAPKDAKDIKLISLIHVADAITMMLGTGMGNDGMMYKIEMKSLEDLKIPPNSTSIELLISDMLELNSEISEMVGMVND